MCFRAAREGVVDKPDNYALGLRIDPDFDKFRGDPALQDDRHVLNAGPVVSKARRASNRC